MGKVMAPLVTGQQFNVFKKIMNGNKLSIKARETSFLDGC